MRAQIHATKKRVNTRYNNAKETWYIVTYMDGVHIKLLKPRANGWPYIHHWRGPGMQLPYYTQGALALKWLKGWLL